MSNTRSLEEVPERRQIDPLVAILRFVPDGERGRRDRVGGRQTDAVDALALDVEDEAVVVHHVGEDPLDLLGLLDDEGPVPEVRGDVLVRRVGAVPDRGDEIALAVADRAAPFGPGLGVLRLPARIRNRPLIPVQPVHALQLGRGRLDVGLRHATRRHRHEGSQDHDRDTHEEACCKHAATAPRRAHAGLR
jgi:hypothetical protein